MKAHDEYLELVSGYALGALEDDDRRALEEHLATGCVSCRSALREAQDVADQLAGAVTPVAPPPELKTRLLARIRNEDSEPFERRPSTVFWPLAAAAGLVAAIGVTFYARSLYEDAERERQARIELESRLAEVQTSVSAMTGPSTRVVSLSGTDASSNAIAQAFLDPETGQLLLYVHNLPPLGPGQTYQLWVIVSGQPASAGIFGTQPDGSARHTDALPTTVEGNVTLAITVEPEGGVPQPTGDILLISS